MTAKIRYAVLEGHLNDPMTAHSEDIYDTLDEAGRRYDEIDLGHMWEVEYQTSGGLSTKDFCKEIVEVESEWDEDFEEWTCEYGNTIEREEYTLDDHKARDLGEIFQEHELDAFLGEPDDFDVEAIIEEATEVDYKTGNRVWAVDTDELNAIAERHRKPQDDAPKWDNGSIVAVLIEGGSKGYDELVAYDINAHKFVDDDGNLVDDDYRPEYDAHQFVLVDYNEVDFDVENEAEWLEYAGSECGLVFEPGLTRDNGSNSSVDYYRIAGRR